MTPQPTTREKILRVTGALRKWGEQVNRSVNERPLTGSINQAGQSDIVDNQMLRPSTKLKILSSQISSIVNDLQQNRISLDFAKQKISEKISQLQEVLKTL